MLSIDEIRKYTMVEARHLLYMGTLVDAINKAGLQGAIVECGVWKGGCVMYMMQCQKQYGQDRHFYLYDTFDGMTVPSNEKDGALALATFRAIEKGELSRAYDAWHGKAKWAFSPLELVQEHIRLIEYAPEKISFVQGDVCVTRC